MSSWKKFHGSVRFKELLKKHVTFRLGGPAKVFARPRDALDLKVLIACAKEDKIPLLLLGAGSNLLVADSGVPAIVCSMRVPAFSRINFEGAYVEAGAGCMLSRLVVSCAAKGLSGLEFCAGIPGSVGGAVLMNAGAWGKSVSECIEEVTVMRASGKVEVIAAREIPFCYRDSGLKGVIVLSARFKVRRGTPGACRKRIAAFAKKRHATQDIRHFSAGCIFKNPQGVSAGKLIEACGLKGASLGNAWISQDHANFIVHGGEGRAADVMGLMRLARSRVARKFGVRLEPEVKIWK